MRKRVTFAYVDNYSSPTPYKDTIFFSYNDANIYKDDIRYTYLKYDKNHIASIQTSYGIDLIYSYEPYIISANHIRMKSSHICCLYNPNAASNSYIVNLYDIFYNDFDTTGIHIYEKDDNIKPINKPNEYDLGNIDTAITKSMTLDNLYLNVIEFPNIEKSQSTSKASYAPVKITVDFSPFLEKFTLDPNEFIYSYNEQDTSSDVYKYSSIQHYENSLYGTSYTYNGEILKSSIPSYTVTYIEDDNPGSGNESTTYHSITSSKVNAIKVVPCTDDSVYELNVEYPKFYYIYLYEIKAGFSQRTMNSNLYNYVKIKFPGSTNNDAKNYPIIYEYEVVIPRVDPHRPGQLKPPYGIIKNFEAPYIGTLQCSADYAYNGQYVSCPFKIYMSAPLEKLKGIQGNPSFSILDESASLSHTQLLEGDILSSIEIETNPKGLHSSFEFCLQSKHFSSTDISQYKDLCYIYSDHNKLESSSDNDTYLTYIGDVDKSQGSNIKYILDTPKYNPDLSHSSYFANKFPDSFNGDHVTVTAYLKQHNATTEIKRIDDIKIDIYKLNSKKVHVEYEDSSVHNITSNPNYLLSNCYIGDGDHTPLQSIQSYIGWISKNYKENLFNKVGAISFTLGRKARESTLFPDDITDDVSQYMNIYTEDMYNEEDDASMYHYHNVRHIYISDFKQPGYYILSTKLNNTYLYNSFSSSNNYYNSNIDKDDFSTTDSLYFKLWLSKTVDNTQDQPIIAYECQTIMFTGVPSSYIWTDNTTYTRESISTLSPPRYIKVLKEQPNIYVRDHEYPTIDTCRMYVDRLSQFDNVNYNDKVLGDRPDLVGNSPTTLSNINWNFTYYNTDYSTINLKYNKPFKFYPILPIMTTYSNIITNSKITTTDAGIRQLSGDYDISNSANVENDLMKPLIISYMTNNNDRAAALAINIDISYKVTKNGDSGDYTEEFSLIDESPNRKKLLCSKSISNWNQSDVYVVTITERLYHQYPNIYYKYDSDNRSFKNIITIKKNNIIINNITLTDVFLFYNVKDTDNKYYSCEFIYYSGNSKPENLQLPNFSNMPFIIEKLVSNNEYKFKFTINSDNISSDASYDIYDININHEDGTLLKTIHVYLVSLLLSSSMYPLGIFDDMYYINDDQNHFIGQESTLFTSYRMQLSLSCSKNYGKEEELNSIFDNISKILNIENNIVKDIKYSWQYISYPINGVNTTLLTNLPLSTSSNPIIYDISSDEFTITKNSQDYILVKVIKKDSQSGDYEGQVNFVNHNSSNSSLTLKNNINKFNYISPTNKRDIFTNGQPPQQN